MTADEGIEMDEGYILYNYGYNNVRIGGIGDSTPTYTITVQNDGHGTGGASLSSAEAGTEIILTVTPSSGYVFKEWQVISGGVTVSGNKFTMPAGNVTVKAIFEATSAPTYPITVQNDGNGTGSASSTSAEAGTEITLTASPSSGYMFKAWQIISGGVTITGNKFTMPANNVTVKAIFEKTLVQTYTVTVNDSYASTSGSGSYTKDATVNIYAGNRNNYTFSGWTSSDVTIIGIGSKNASFVMPGKAVTVTANWRDNGGGGGSDSSGDSGSTTTIITPGKKPDQPISAVIAITVTAGENGTASAVIPDKAITDAIAKAQSSARIYRSKC